MHSLANIGNMVGVYRATRERAEREINDVVRNTSSMEAEITEGSRADWYLINTFAGEDLKAMRYLARRRFGLFRPMQQRTKARNEGQSIGGMEPVFPGWLFVYCWDVKAMRSRILSAPGVFSMLCDPVTLDPVTIGDDFIQRLRGKAWVFEERLTRIARDGARNEYRQKPRRPDKRERKALDRLKKAVKDRGFDWDESTWADVNRLEPHERIALLQRTLCPPSMVSAPSGCGG